LRETRLTHTPSNELDHEPTWSPDGKQIAFVKDLLKSRGPSAALYIMNSDGSNPAPVFEVEGEQADHPDWGPRP
jgi:Tol biopolymer transport system component